MKNYQQVLTELLQLTEDLYHQAKAIKSNMKDNEPEQLEKVQALVEQREASINQLDACLNQVNFNWDEQDQIIIDKLKDYQQVIQPLMSNLHQSFSSQITQLNQRKQMSKKYIGAYQTLSTDGSFIDQRK